MDPGSRPLCGPGSSPGQALGRDDEADSIAAPRQKETLRPGRKIPTNPHRFRRLRGKYSRRPFSARAGRAQGRGRLLPEYQSAARRSSMRALSLAILAVATALLVPSVRAEEIPKDVKGVYLLTDYPAVTVRPGTTSTVSLRLQNYGQAPERLALKVDGVPSGWTATLLGGGQPVAAAMPAPDASVPLQLRLDVPANTALSAQTLTVKAEGQGSEAELPLNVALAKELPAKLTVTSKLPSLRGSQKSNFEFTLNVKNDSGRNLV